MSNCGTQNSLFKRWKSKTATFKVIPCFLPEDMPLNTTRKNPNCNSSHACTNLPRQKCCLRIKIKVAIRTFFSELKSMKRRKRKLETSLNSWRNLPFLTFMILASQLKMGSTISPVPGNSAVEEASSQVSFCQSKKHKSTSTKLWSESLWKPKINFYTTIKCPKASINLNFTWTK